MSEEKRVRRTPEQIAADLDVQIEKLKDSILELENKKAASATEFDNKIAAVKEKIAKLEAKKKDAGNGLWHGTRTDCHRIISKPFGKCLA